MGERIQLTLVKKESFPVSKRRSFTFTWLSKVCSKSGLKANSPRMAVCTLKQAACSVTNVNASVTA